MSVSLSEKKLDIKTVSRELPIYVRALQFVELAAVTFIPEADAKQTEKLKFK